MEPVISLPYSEYESIIHIQRHFKKAKGYSVCVPVSRQQKGLDFIVLKNRKALRFQVKASRPFTRSSKKETNKKRYNYTFWFSNFFDRYKPHAADVYLLFGLFPVYHTGQNIKNRNKFWKSIVLAFTDREMERFLASLWTKGGTSRERFFYISFDRPEEVYVTRGRTDIPNISKHLLERRIDILLKKLS